LPLVPRETIDDVRDRTNVVEVVKRYVELTWAGTRSWNSAFRRVVRSASEIAMRDRQFAGARTRDDDEEARALMRRGMTLTKTKQGLTGALERP
jgi:hypothetical protein